MLLSHASRMDACESVGVPICVCVCACMVGPCVGEIGASEMAVYVEGVCVEGMCEQGSSTHLCVRPRI